MARFLPKGLNVDLGLGHMGIIGGLHLVGVQPSAQIALHQLVKELDILGQGTGQLLGRAVPVGHRDAAQELAVIQGVFDPRPGEGGQVGILDPLPQAEEGRHGLDQRGGLSAEHHRELADGLLPAAVELHLIFYRGPVFVFQRALQRHGEGVGREEGHQLPGGAEQLLDGGEHVVDAPLRGGVAHVLGQDLIDEAGAVGANPVGHGVHLPDHLVVEHQAVQGLFHRRSSLSFSHGPMIPHRVNFVKYYI